MTLNSREPPMEDTDRRRLSKEDDRQWKISFDEDDLLGEQWKNGFNGVHPLRYLLSFVNM